MSTLYRIHWICALTGEKGHGSVTYPKWRAQQIVDQLNGQPEYQRLQLRHWVEPVRGIKTVEPVASEADNA